MRERERVPRLYYCSCLLHVRGSSKVNFLSSVRWSCHYAHFHKQGATARHVTTVSQPQREEFVHETTTLVSRESPQCHLNGRKIEITHPLMCPSCQGCDQFFLPMASSCKCPCCVGNILWMELAQPTLRCSRHGRK